MSAEDHQLSAEQFAALSEGAARALANDLARHLHAFPWDEVTREAIANIYAMYLKDATQTACQIIRAASKSTRS